MAPTLDQQITDTLGALSVLLIFVIAYYTVLWSGSQQAIDKTKPTDSVDRKADRTNVVHRLFLVLGAFLLTLAVLLLVYPLSHQTLATWPKGVTWPSDAFPTLRGALLLVDFFLFITAAALLWLGARLFVKWLDLGRP